jgi:hypothetical protein
MVPVGHIEAAPRFAAAFMQSRSQEPRSSPCDPGGIVAGRFPFSDDMS